MKKKSSRILALICVIILVVLNIAALILAFIPDKAISQWSMPCFITSLILPVILFLHLKVITFLKGEDNDPSTSSQEENQP